jgi:hypothetical protein
MTTETHKDRAVRATAVRRVEISGDTLQTLLSRRR